MHIYVYTRRNENLILVRRYRIAVKTWEEFHENHFGLVIRTTACASHYPQKKKKVTTSTWNWTGGRVFVFQCFLLIVGKYFKVCYS